MKKPVSETDFQDLNLIKRGKAEEAIAAIDRLPFAIKPALLKAGLLSQLDRHDESGYRSGLR